MSEIIVSSSSNALPVPLPKEPLTFRSGNAGDFAFIDELQKHYNKQLGFMPKSWLEGKIKADQILIAEVGCVSDAPKSGASEMHPTRVGYIIAQDRYLKRDELGIVYQLAVKPGMQRGFIGAALLKAQFDRSEYGCRLYCCWCAQDIDANKFWESMGFYPLAFRNGADGKGKNGPDGKKKPRVQIFWQKKIRGKDDTINWWFPAKTEAGAMGADRLALPIPPNVHWSEVEPIEIPTISGEKLVESGEVKKKRLSTKVSSLSTSPKPQMLFGPPGMVIEQPKKEEPVVEPSKERATRARKPKAKIDPVFIKQSKELRARYLEQVNEHGYKLESAGKYDLSRLAPRLVAGESSIPLLEAA